jgi:PAS domain S-box-containing protein
VSGPESSNLSALRRRNAILEGEAVEQREENAELTADLAQRTEQGIATEQLFRRLVESVRDYAIFMLDPTGHVATWNVGAERIKGYRADEIIGSHFSRFYLPEEVASGKCAYELEVAAEVGRFEDEGWRVRKDGTTMWANVIISAVRDDDGQLVGFSKVTRDLTERRRAEEERAARLAAEQATRAKDEFLAMLGHELRNPLSPIVTALDLIRMRGDDRSRKEIGIIERQVKHLMRLVDDLLDVSRIARGKVELRKRLIDMRDVVARTVETTAPMLEHRRQRLHLEVPPRAAIVNGDQARLLQVLSNLVTNASKYTEPGGNVRLRMTTALDALAIEVEDDGIGISPTLLPRVFELFVQGDQSAERSSGGLGLGLTLARTLVELHGGTVEARSPGLGHGSTFTVRLPLADASRASVEDGASERLERAARPRRVLLVDDNDDARVLLADLLLAVGHEVEDASDATSALALLDRFTPDVVILDIGLPVMDGYELAAVIRARAGDRPPHLIALTGYGRPNDVVRSREAGFGDHLVKPADLPRLLASIEGAPRLDEPT